ncbi:Gypsy retrotransposon integrase-like protein 1 [Vitis vinifera]|uniref:Gypsy retrotransposon integrase-like protein 1 n=1 Tax=Vitis vinifera TaxID=29760 RepID=A0A438HB00_VITVI|nr:Gypsy retrotransposon integrase-like protein 1 [Vitis vinifera]
MSGGIEVDPDKIRAILDMPAPRIEREVRGFLGRLQYISKFIARLTDILSPSERALSRIIWLLYQVSDGKAIDDDFPDEDVAAVTSFFRMAHICSFGILGSTSGTNNIVEYEACILGLETALELEIRQMERRNQFADALATLASMIDIPVGATIDDGLPWYHDIYHFLRLGEYPEAATAKDRKALRQLAARFVICGETLYRRSADGMLLLCLDRASADRVMREVHVGVCGPHMRGHMLARKIMRTGYFWLTMETDCCQFVQRCPECQIHEDLIHVPPSELHALTSPWPFSVWGIDIIGKISPKSSSGDEFILVTIDYFTKWVEAASYARLTLAGVACFIRSHIICRYGVPHELISDRGTNGAVEAANKNIKRILTEDGRDFSRLVREAPIRFVGILDFFSHLYRSTPYSLVYGMEAVLLVEIEMGSLRVALEQQIPEMDWAQADLIS